MRATKSNRHRRLIHKLVHYIPEVVDEGILYVSRHYRTAVHKCCCGCGEEVVTPLGPTEWSIEVEPAGVTIFPSIGNWSYACRSHYWVKQGRVIWAGEMSQRDIERGRACDQAAKRRHFALINRKKTIARFIKSLNPLNWIRWVRARTK